jgi:hypothetical protein
MGDDSSESVDGEQTYGDGVNVAASAFSVLSMSR